MRALKTSLLLLLVFGLALPVQGQDAATEKVEKTMEGYQQAYQKLLAEYQREQDAEGGFGKLTGILLDSSESRHGGSKKVIDPEMLWLKSRF